MVFGIESYVAEVTTDARATTCSEIRNLVSFADNVGYVVITKTRCGF